VVLWGNAEIVSISDPKAIDIVERVVEVDADSDGDLPLPWSARWRGRTSLAVITTVVMVLGAAEIADISLFGLMYLGRDKDALWDGDRFAASADFDPA
jgi:hypothetical protein